MEDDALPFVVWLPFGPLLDLGFVGDGVLVGLITAVMKSFDFNGIAVRDMLLLSLFFHRWREGFRDKCFTDNFYSVCGQTRKCKRHADRHVVITTMIYLPGKPHTINSQNI